MPKSLLLLILMVLCVATQACNISATVDPTDIIQAPPVAPTKPPLPLPKNTPPTPRFASPNPKPVTPTTDPGALMYTQLRIQSPLE